jgi:hypothetical protein
LALSSLASPTLLRGISLLAVILRGARIFGKRATAKALTRSAPDLVAAGPSNATNNHIIIERMA